MLLNPPGHGFDNKHCLVIVENMSPQKNSFPSGFLYSATTGLGFVVVMVGLISGAVVTSGVGELTTAVVGGGGVIAITGGGGSMVCVDGRGTIAAVADGEGVVGSEEQIFGVLNGIKGLLSHTP
jgi:hypothetical protein